MGKYRFGYGFALCKWEEERGELDRKEGKNVASAEGLF